MREGGRYVSDRISGLLVGSPAGSQAPKNCQGGPAPRHPTGAAPPERRPRCAAELESTVRYLGIEVEHALELSEQTDIQLPSAKGGKRK